MFRRPASLRGAFVALAMLLMTLPALAFLELPNQTQLAFNNILFVIDTVANPSAKQQLAQRRVSKSTEKLFRSGRTLRQCLKDMEKTLRKAGPHFEDVEFAGQTVGEMRAILARRLIDDVSNAGLALSSSISSENPDASQATLERALRPLNKATDLAIGLSVANASLDSLDAKELRRVFRDLGRAVELMERAARRAKKAKLGNFSVVVPSSS